MEDITSGLTIIHGDAYQLIADMPDDASLITDPPYGQNYVSHHNNNRKRQEYIRIDGDFEPIEGDDRPFDPLMFLRFKNVCLWGANNYSDKLPVKRGWLIWDKLDGKTPSDSSDCEIAWTNRDSPVRIFTHLWRGIMRAGEENIVHSAKLHPNQKPVALMAWCLEVLAIPRGSLVIDPFMGSASLGVACYRNGYQYIGIEKSIKWYEVARDRLQRESRQITMFSMNRVVGDIE